MTDVWLRFAGLAMATVLLVYLIVRCIQPLITGVLRFGSGIMVRRENNPGDFALWVRLQIAGTLIFFAAYAYVLYKNFFINLGWI